MLSYHCTLDAIFTACLMPFSLHSRSHFYCIRRSRLHLGPSQPVLCTSILRLRTSNLSRPTGTWRFRSQVPRDGHFSTMKGLFRMPHGLTQRRGIGGVHDMSSFSYILFHIIYSMRQIFFDVHIMSTPLLNRSGQNDKMPKMPRLFHFFLHVRFFGLWSSLP